MVSSILTGRLRNLPELRFKAANSIALVLALSLLCGILGTSFVSLKKEWGERVVEAATKHRISSHKLDKRLNDSDSLI